jgi:alpha-methylacyl-CoA racemase
MAGALDGVRIVEMAGLGPVPFAGMMLADHGAEVIRVERHGVPHHEQSIDLLNRSRKTIRIDLKYESGRQVVRELVRGVDGIIEGFRPGVMERLGLGPVELVAENSRLVYGRMTGWGQSGPYAAEAGHDINYIALSGALHAIGRAGGKPTPPLNLVGDFGGGGMFLAFGMVAALLSAGRTGRGQVIDCAMTDGAALLMTMIWSMRAAGQWRDERGMNFLDSGAPFYDVYECADGRHVSIGSIEPRFFALLLKKLEIEHDMADRQFDRSAWPAIRERIAARFLTRTRDEWCTIMEHSDACFAPVLSLTEAPRHPHNAARATFIDVGGIVQPAPAPRFSETPASTPLKPAAAPGAAATDELLQGFGIDAARIQRLRNEGALA